MRTLPVSITGQTTPATIQNYDYDKVGQVTKHVQSIGNQSYTLEYGYNLAGQLVSEKYPSGKIVNMTVDNYGRLATVGDAQKTYLTGVTFNSQGLLSQLNLGNFTSETFTYNDRFQMTSQSLSRGAEVLQKYDYSYGTTDLATGSIDATKNNGQLGKIEGWIGASKQWSQRFGYDELGRLKETREYKQGDNAQLTYKQVFDFDRFGNLYRKAINNPTTGQQNPLPFTTIEDADINKATNRFATGTTYDEAGQVVADNKFRSLGFAYDANGRQVKATKTGVPDACTVYDALGNRVATKINDVWQYMIYDAFGKLVAEYGLPSEGTGGVKYIQQDWQGSVRTVTNKAAFVVSRTDHQAFGEEISAGIGLRTAQQGFGNISGQRQGYGLTEKDDTGLNHTWFRKNENKAGRWTSPDPYKGSMNLANPQSFNRYAYVGNDPTNLVDPSGLCSWTAPYTTGPGGTIILGPVTWVTPCNVGSSGSGSGGVGGGGGILGGGGVFLPEEPPVEGPSVDGGVGGSIRSNIIGHNPRYPNGNPEFKKCIKRVTDGVRNYLRDNTTPVSLFNLTWKDLSDAGPGAIIGTITGGITGGIGGAVSGFVLGYVTSLVGLWGWRILKQFALNAAARSYVTTRLIIGVIGCYQAYGHEM